MGVDYVVDLPCEPKQALGTQTIVDLIKARARAERVRDLFRAQGDSGPLSEMTFETVTLRPEGPVRELVSVASLLESAAALDPHTAACEGCVGRSEARAFGCIGHVTYPLRAATEAWLLEQLPDALDSTAFELLSRAVADFSWDGSYTVDLRGQGQTFFEARATPVRRWAEEFALSGDQLWQMLFGLGDLSPPHSLMCALFLGVIPHRTTAGELGALSDDPSTIAGFALRYDADHEDWQIRELQRFFRALGLAAALGVPILVDG